MIEGGSTHTTVPTTVIIVGAIPMSRSVSLLTQHTTVACQFQLCTPLCCQACISMLLPLEPKCERRLTSCEGGEEDDLMLDITVPSASPGASSENQFQWSARL